MAQNPTPSHLDQNQIMQRAFDETNDRLRVDTSATIVAGAMEVLINANDDNITVGGTEDGTFTGVKHALKVASNGAAITNQASQLIGPIVFDSIVYGGTTTTDTMQYKVGGVSGTLVATVTLTYTDATKTNLVSAVKT